MGLDVGEKTIGIAVSDELGIGANPLTVVSRTGSVKREIAEVCRIAEEYKVGRIVVGMPLMLNGTAGIQAAKATVFAEALQRRSKIPVIMWDERLSTAEVERMLIASDQSRAKRKKVIDKLAAAVILQSYLDRQRSGASEQGGSDGDQG
jgi:putative Holliday junction resolvase